MLFISRLISQADSRDPRLHPFSSTSRLCTPGVLPLSAVACCRLLPDLHDGEMEAQPTCDPPKMSGSSQQECHQCFSASYLDGAAPTDDRE
ncbi:unnamed protein product [Arctogadus glacialis]